MAAVPSDVPADALLSRLAPLIDDLKARGGYVTADVIDVSPATPGLDAMLARFNTEHWHDEDEVRLIVEGRGLFHVHPPGQPVFAIEVDGHACGGIAARPGDGERGQSAELGYWLGRSLWGRGLMTRVVALYAPWAMQRMALFRLQATVLDFNEASARVLLKNGFIEEGVARCALLKNGEPHDLRVFAKVRRSLCDAP